MGPRAAAAAILTLVAGAASAAPACKAPDWAPKAPLGYELASCDHRIWAELPLSLADGEKTAGGERLRVTYERKDEANNLSAEAARVFYERQAAAGGAKLASNPGGYGAVFRKDAGGATVWELYDHGSGNEDVTGSFVLTTLTETRFPQIVAARPMPAEGLQAPGKPCSGPPWVAKSLPGFHVANCAYRDFDSVTFETPDASKTLAGRVLTVDYALDDGAEPLVAVLGTRNFATAAQSIGATRVGDPNDAYRAYATLKADKAEYWFLYQQSGGNEEENSAFQVTTVEIGGPPPKACTLEVYGVNFDFDRATLREDSTPVLDQVLALFQADPSYAAEVGGHTDNVGGAAYNLKLSGARAGSVRAWLVAHGVEAKRVTARGYGDNKPVASNANDEGRAKNRRVELKRAKCAG